VCAHLVASVVQSIAIAVEADEPQITHYDTIAGDGDCGETLLNGANGPYILPVLSTFHASST